MVDTKARTRGFGRIGGADTLTSGSNASTAKLNFFQTIDLLMEIKHQVSSVRDEKAAISIKTYRCRERTLRITVETPFLANSKWTDP